MNKSELLEAVAARNDIAKAEAGRFLDGLVDVIGKELSKGGEVSIAGFGKFEVRERAARTGRNPKTGETIQIAASKAPAFKAAKAFKDQI